MTGRRLWIFLVLSLGANLFLGGLFVGHLVFDRRSPPPPPRIRLDMRHGMEALTPAVREKTSQLWRLRQPELRKQLRLVRVARRDLRRVLESETSTREQIETAFQEVRKRSDEVQEAFQKVLREIAVSLPADQRKAFFRAVFERPNRRHRPHRD